MRAAIVICIIAVFFSLYVAHRYREGARYWETRAEREIERGRNCASAIENVHGAMRRGRDRENALNTRLGETERLLFETRWQRNTLQARVGAHCPALWREVPPYTNNP